MRARQEAGGRRQENYNLILKTDLVLGIILGEFGIVDFRIIPDS